MSEVQPLIDVREHETFLQDKAAVEHVLAHARTLASSKPFTEEEAWQAADVIKSLGHVGKDAEAHKLAITAEHRATVAAVNVEYKELQSPIDAAKAALKDKSLEWKRARDAEAAEEQRQRQAEIDRKAEEAALQAQEAAELAAEAPSDPEMRELAAEARHEAAVAAVAPPPAPVAQPKQVRGGFGSLGSRIEWRFEVIDSALVPNQHRIVDTKALKAAVQAEARAAKAEQREFKLEIPGVRIYPHEIAVSR